MSELSLFEQLNRKKDADKLQTKNSLTQNVSKTTTDHDSIRQTTTDQVEPRPRQTKLVDFQLPVSNVNDKLNLVETSPSKNFTKVPNSITRQAIPSKFFRGLSKHTYDVLFQQTRGAIVPKRLIQLTKSELVDLTGLSIHAVKLHIKYLKESGLIASQPSMGNHTGWTYEIFIPEELETTDHDRPRQTTTDHDKTDQVMDSDQDHNLVCLTPTNTLENKEVNSNPKTFFKYKRRDDDDTRVTDATLTLAKKLDAAAKKFTGKGLSKNEVEKWGSLADLLILELEKAAKNAETISSLPAFLTEVLRRQFFAAQKPITKFSKNSTKNKPDVIGKPNTAESYEIKPLDTEGRKEALSQLEEFADDDFLIDFKKWYTAEDWQWLIDNLPKEEKQSG